jgi:hypothetical protein
VLVLYDWSSDALVSVKQGLSGNKNKNKNSSKPRSMVFANFCFVNLPTMAAFMPPM